MWNEEIVLPDVSSVPAPTSLPVNKRKRKGEKSGVSNATPDFFELNVMTDE